MLLYAAYVVVDFCHDIVPYCYRKVIIKFLVLAPVPARYFLPCCYLEKSISSKFQKTESGTLLVTVRYVCQHWSDWVCLSDCLISPFCSHFDLSTYSDSMHCLLTCCSHLLHRCTTAHPGLDLVRSLPHHLCQVSRHLCLLQQHQWLATAPS